MQQNQTISRSTAADLDAIDREAVQVARDVVEGRTCELDGRWQIALLVHRSNITTRVARSYLSKEGQYDSQLADDLAARLLNLLMVKIVPSSTSTPNDWRSNPNSDYDMQVGASGASFAGWARHLAGAACASELRNLRTDCGHQVLVAPVMSGGKDIKGGTDASSEMERYAADAGYVAPGPAEAMDMEADTALLNGFIQRAHNARSSERTQMRARTLAEHLQIPRPSRPEDPGTRAELRTKLEADETLALASIKRRLAAGGGSVVDLGEEDLGMSEVWQGYHPDHLSELVSRDPRIVHILAMSAVSPLPAPRIRSLSILKQRVALMGPEGDRRWSQKARALVSAWADYVTEEPSQYGPSSARDVDSKSDDEIRMDRRRFERAAEAAIAHPGSVIGDDPYSVHKLLSSHLENIDDELAGLKPGSAAAVPA